MAGPSIVAHSAHPAIMRGLVLNNSKKKVLFVPPFSLLPLFYCALQKGQGQHCPPPQRAITSSLQSCSIYSAQTFGANAKMPGVVTGLSNIYSLRLSWANCIIMHYGILLLMCIKDTSRRLRHTNIEVNQLYSIHWCHIEKKFPPHIDHAAKLAINGNLICIDYYSISAFTSQLKSWLIS